ncbi:MAG TPA: ELM1/GtrOC1 family putative glycosyltransferase, partial [Solirubrobacteraceae bacterium]
MSRDAIAPTWNAADPAVAPRIWVLLGDKAGDNEQCLALAEALGWPHDVKHLAYNRHFRRWNVRLGAALTSVDRERSDPLVPPWPDLVVGVGRRSVPVARWIRRQNADRTRLVQLGRPRAPLGWFDLVVTTPQYGLPARDNVVILALPPVRRRLPEGAAAASWAALPRPRIAVLVGGRGDPFTIDPVAAAHLGRSASALATRLGGSLLIATSRRTEPATVDALAANLHAPHVLQCWSPEPTTNPYPVLLADADRFVVTGDSMSMLADAVATGKPVALFPGTHRP